jgi:hypothetical protein
MPVAAPTPRRLPMMFRPALAATLLGLASTAFAATPVYLTVDQSSPLLIDAKAVTAIWAGALPVARLAKLYPVSKWGFASDVHGGLTSTGMCVVTARAMLLPRRGKVLVFNPEHKATSFDAQPGLSKDQCSALATDKLKESIQAVLSSLIKA